MAKELTRRAIISAFLKLVDERPVDKITIKDIASECGINRNTFYYHYQDIYGVMEDIFKEEAERIVAPHPTREDWEESFRLGIQFVLEHRRAVYHIYNSSGRDTVENYVFHVASDCMKDFVKNEIAGLSVAESDINLITSFYIHGCEGIVMDWLKAGMEADFSNTVVRLETLCKGSIRRSIVENGL